MKVLRVILGCVALCGGLENAIASPARFWISSSRDNPIEPEAPIIAPEGREKTLYIWAQPATGKTLQSVSLNLRHQPQSPNSVMPVVDFLDTKIDVYNPQVNGQPRFQFVYDSFPPPPPLFQTTLKSIATEADVLDGLADGIGVLNDGGSDIQGFTIATEGYTGIGASPGIGGCYDGDLCAVTSNGPAWLVAELAFKSVRPVGSNEYYLQIGYNGMNHRGENSALTDVTFGHGLVPIYNAGHLDHQGTLDHRQVTLPGDSPDVQIVAVPFKPGDFNGDNNIGPEDYQHWKSSFAQQVTPGSGSDGNRNGVIDAADYVFWRNQWVAGGGGSTSGSYLPNNIEQMIVPEPYGLASLLLILVPLVWPSRK